MDTTQDLAGPVTKAAGDNRRLLMALRQTLIMMIGALEDYLGITRDKSALVARRVN